MVFKKTLALLGAVAMLLSSCSKISEVKNPNGYTGLSREITATFDATRTSVDNDWNTVWNDNDEMTVYVTRESGSGRKYGYSQFKYKGDGKFDGTVNKDFCSPYNWFAVYPAFQSSSSTSSKVEAAIEHPATQTMVGDTKAHIAGANDPIFGYALGVEDNPTIRMHHIASVIDFNITNGSDNAIKVTKVEFTAPEKIAGEFTADIDLWNGDVQAPVWEADDSAVNTVTLDVSDGAEIANNGSGHFYAAIHPISAKGNYTIKVTATSGGKTYVAEKTANAELSFKAGKYRALNFTFVPGAPEPDEKCYVKVTSAPQDWSGTYIIVDESAGKAFDENASSYASTVSISSGKVAWSETVAKYQVTVSPSSVSGMYDIKTVKGKYMYSYNYGKDVLNSSNGSSNTYYNSLSISGGDVTMYSTRTGSGGSVNYFGYVSSTSDNPNSKNFGYKEDATTRTVQLYKLNEGSTPAKQDQTIAFAESEMEWTLGDIYKVGNTYDAQSVSGAQTTVTLSSSNASVATISDGKIKIVGEGSTTITATAAEDDTYYGATASYTLTIKPASAPSAEKTYKKVTSISEGTYIICGSESSGTYVCLFPPVTASNNSFSTSNKCEHTQFSSSNSITEISTSDASIIGSEVEITKSGTSWLVKVKANGMYMYHNDNAIAFTSSASSAAQTISLSSGKGVIKTGSYEFYHSGSDAGFGYKSNKGANNLMFFKLDESATPSTKQDQTLSFANATVEWTLGDTYMVNSTYAAQSVSGAQTTVTFTSSNASVATITNDGKIKIAGEGSTTITATAAEDDTYYGATASYTLTIKPASAPSTKKTYKKVTSISEGTYIICGYESDSGKKGTYVCTFPPVTATSSSIKTSNRCEEFKFSDDNTITEITTDNASIIGSEVKITKSGSNWLVQYDGKYMYYNDGAIAFITSSSSAAQSISLSSGKGAMKSGNQEFYHSGTDKAFGYATNKGANNLMFFKLDGDTPSTPETASFNIENEMLAAYLDAVEASPYFTNNNFGSYDSYYTSSLMKSSKYYSGSSSSNRLDQPTPVVITWSGNATKIEVFTSSSRTSSSRVASESFSSSSSASIYNLIPGQKYYYTATNGSTTVATGDFTPTGRRRMIKVSSSFDASHAANCRDFGGLPTVDGKHVKYGLIYRGSNIDGLSSDNDAKDVFLNTMKIKWDIDLRASNEKGSAPTFSGVSKGTQSYSASFDDSNLRSKTKVATTLKEIIDAINKDTPEPVYIHCRIGSDRTGYICLLVEALIGVTQNYCDTDYEITSFAGNVTGTRFRVDDTYGGGMYKSGIKYIADYSGTSLHEKVYDFVTSSSGLNISKTDVDKFISRMKE